MRAKIPEASLARGYGHRLAAIVACCILQRDLWTDPAIVVHGDVVSDTKIEIAFRIEGRLSSNLISL